MRKGLLHIITSSLLFYKKAVAIQVIIISILAAVITGSLLTGFSVRNSLKTTALERMGSASILVTSGLRYFDPDLSLRFSKNTGEKAISLLETEGFCQNFAEGTRSGKVKIFGVGPDFFSFHNKSNLAIKPGEVAINRKLAANINVNEGDELILRLKDISDIPADAPFAVSAPEGTSIVLKVGVILEGDEGGDFSLGINQIVPANIFINLEDLVSSTGLKKTRVNRIISENNSNSNSGFFNSALNKTLTINDLGLVLRKTKLSGFTEIISDRIFIDQLILDDIRKIIPSASPVITYLSNSISTGDLKTPYSFVSAIPSSLYNDIPREKGTVINKWLASDIGAKAGDTIKMTWFAPDSIDQLKEKSQFFPVIAVVNMDSVWGDPDLMPDFPGIAGTESCSQWDAGVPVDMDKIREKDEDYWTKYKGTPKAFITYEYGKELWGSNYGPATAIRFPDINSQQIENELKGKFDPARSGFLVTDLRQDALKAANNSVDFGTLFISLGFFIILASVLLLSLSVSSWFENKKDHISILYSLGFNNGTIYGMLLSETFLIAIAGSLAGAALGILVNILIITALNSVWSGAVQTNTLSASVGIIPFITGFISSMLIILVFFMLRTRNFLKSLDKKKSGVFRLPSIRRNSIYLITSSVLAISLFVLSLISEGKAAEVSFATGIFFFLSFILLLRHYYLGGLTYKSGTIKSFSQLSFLYYRHNPSQAITPAIFIAAGIFALFITSLNRMNFNEQANNPKSGTGGYLFWCETSVSVNEDLSTINGKRTFGLDEDQFKGMNIVQFGRKDGDDASCLNLNYIAAPPLLGVDPEIFAVNDAFSFASVIKDHEGISPWTILGEQPGPNTIYGIADQTVLDWGLKIKTGDTLILKAESGQRINIIIAAGLKSSVFQGHVLIDIRDLRRFFPTVAGSSVFLVNGDPSFSETYKSGIEDRFSNFGIIVEPASARLTAFYQVTNTYLTVFTVLGAFGMILGIFGLGFILLRNYNLRKREFALMLATGIPSGTIRISLLKDLIITMAAGIITGSVSALVATMPSIQANNYLPLLTMLLMIVSIFFTGMIILIVSLRQVKNEALVISLRSE